MPFVPLSEQTKRREALTAVQARDQFAALNEALPGIIEGGTKVFAGIQAKQAAKEKKGERTKVEQVDEFGMTREQFDQAKKDLNEHGEVTDPDLTTEQVQAVNTRIQDEGLAGLTGTKLDRKSFDNQRITTTTRAQRDEDRADRQLFMTQRRLDLQEARQQRAEERERIKIEQRDRELDIKAKQKGLSGKRELSPGGFELTGLTPSQRNAQLRFEKKQREAQEKQLRTERRRFAQDVSKTGFAEALTTFQDLDKALPGGIFGEEDIPGLGVGAGLIPDKGVSLLESVGLTGEGATEIRQILGRLFNIKLKDRSGAAVTVTELERLKQEFGRGAFQSEAALRLAIKSALTGVKREMKNIIEAGAGKEVVEAFRAEKGITSADLPNELSGFFPNPEAAPTPKEQQAIQFVLNGDPDDPQVLSVFRVLKKKGLMVRGQ